MLLAIPALSLASDDAARDSIDTLEREISRLRQEYADRQAALAREMDARLSALEARIVARDKSEETPAKPAVADALLTRTDGPLASSASALNVHGDFRLRYEHTSGHAGQMSRNRAVLRGRIGASYGFNEYFDIGGRLTTGDPDDPNSADTTMGDFVDDLTVSLDRAYARFANDRLEIVGGKFANPLTRTDLVWDGDVNPYGVAGRYDIYESGGTGIGVTAIYSIVDEQSASADSDMAGMQATLDLRPMDAWQIGFNAAYYDYRIGSLAAADGGDIRGNNLAQGGTAYLSDFDLLDFIVSAGYEGPIDGWPIKVVGNYVRNLGAAVPEDSAWSVDLSLGALAAAGDWRLGYGYAVAETDAVLAAFSHDNTGIATNYRQHTMTVDYLLLDDIVLNLTGYLYRHHDLALIDHPDGNDQVSRLRLNLQFQF